MTIADAINTALLATAVVGIALTFWQVRRGARTRRVQFLKELYLMLTADPDICSAYYQIECGKFHYGVDFHESELESKIDRGAVSAIPDIRKGDDFLPISISSYLPRSRNPRVLELPIDLL